MNKDGYELAKRHVVESLNEANAEVDALYQITTTDRSIPIATLSITLTLVRLIQAVRKMLNGRSDVLLYVITRQTDTIQTLKDTIAEQQRQINVLANRINNHVHYK